MAVLNESLCQVWLKEVEKAPKLLDLLQLPGVKYQLDKAVAANRHAMFKLWWSRKVAEA